MPDASTIPAAVLWDMDGTLVDTEPYWIAAEYALVEAHGGTWSDAQAHALVGSDLLTAAAIIREQGPVGLEPAAIVEALLADVIVRVAEHTPYRPGALELLSGLGDAGVPCALVTMSWTSLAHAIVEQLPAGTFAAVVTGDEVRFGKPHPEPYLRAAELLGVEPHDCVAIEDSPTGLASAEAAGCHALAVPHVATIEPAPGRTIIDDLSAIDAAWLAAFLQERRAGLRLHGRRRRRCAPRGLWIDRAKLFRAVGQCPARGAEPEHEQRDREWDRPRDVHGVVDVGVGTDREIARRVELEHHPRRDE
ncbi:MAG: HAD family phosphatase [Solirubrobacteraceae bacterium]|nr:HAD family phosphatase [Solirubrobacteraceae bacterium]